MSITTVIDDVLQKLAAQGANTAGVQVTVAAACDRQWLRLIWAETQPGERPRLEIGPGF